MTAAEAQALVESAKCYLCAGVSLPQAITLALEKAWLLSLNPSADTSVSALMASSSCAACYGGSQFDLLEIALLSEIANSI